MGATEAGLLEIRLVDVGAVTPAIRRMASSRRVPVPLHGVDAVAGMGQGHQLCSDGIMILNDVSIRDT